MLCEKKDCIPGAASVHGFSLKSGQSTTVTSTVEKFLANPSSSTIATNISKVNILIKGKGKGKDKKVEVILHLSNHYYFVNSSLEERDSIANEVIGKS